MNTKLCLVKDNEPSFFGKTETGRVTLLPDFRIIPGHI